MIRSLRLPPMLLAAAFAVMSAALADEGGEHASEEDHERARQALERREVLPLAEILAAVRPRIDGEIVGTEFEREDATWVYEIKYIDRAGRMIELYVDAKTAQIIGREDEE
jgi:uncharacterized membrane protein YkoI